MVLMIEIEKMKKINSVFSQFQNDTCTKLTEGTKMCNRDELKGLKRTKN